MRRIVSLITAVLLFATMLPMSAAAEETIPIALPEEVIGLFPTEEAELLRPRFDPEVEERILREATEMRLQIEEEAKRRAKEEARRKAEEEARKKAEEEAEAKRQKVPPRTYDYAFGCKPSEVSRCDANRELGYHMAVEHYDWGGKQFQCLDTLWGRRESGWNNHQQNSKSSAYGIAQFIHNDDNSTWRNMGYAGPTPDPVIQIEAGLKYVKSRYRTPCRALDFSRATVSGNPSLAPSDLQSAARFWVARGYKGY